jgi:hypothetical protein
MMFEENTFISDFYKYIKRTYGVFSGSYDELYIIYSVNYISSIVDTNTVEENKYVAEYLDTVYDNVEISPEAYKRYAYYAYGKFWNRIVKEFSLCEYSDADTDTE